MNIPKVAKVLKQRKRLHLMEDEHGNQWVGEGRAFYLLEGLPRVDAAELLTIFGVTGDDRKKWLAWENTWPVGLNLSEDGVPIEHRLGVQHYNGDEYAPFVYEDRAEREIVWILSAYLPPLRGYDEDMAAFVHFLPGGGRCLVVKGGMFPVAIIGEDCLCSDEAFVERLRDLANLCMRRHNVLFDAGKTGREAMENEVFDFAGEAVELESE